MKVYFANLASDVSKLPDLQNHMIISLSDSSSEELIKRNIKFKTYRDYLSKEDYSQINEISHNLMKSCQGNNELTSIEGIELYDLFIDFYNIFSLIIKKLKLAERVLTKENPDVIYMPDSSIILSKYLCSICLNKKIACNIIIMRTDFFSNIFSILKTYTNTDSFLGALSFILANRKNLKTSILLNLVNELGSLRYSIPTSLFEVIANMIKIQTYSKGNIVQSTSKKKYDVIAFCPINNSVTILAPILQRLKKEKDLDSICITMYSNADDKCKEYNLDYINIFDITPDYEKLVSAKKSIKHNWNVLRNDISFRAKLAYNGTSIFDSVKHSLTIISTLGFMRAIRILYCLDSALSTFSPKLILVADDTGIGGRTLVRLGKVKHIPSVNIQHGTIDDVFRYKEVVSDKMAVWGQHDNNLLVSYGVQSDKLVITGMPRFDLIPNFVPDTKIQILAKLGADPSKKLFLWTPSPYDGVMSQDSQLINKDLMDVLSKTFKQRQFQLVVKIHPLDNVRNYNTDGSVVIVQDIDTLQLIYSCDCLLVTNSTTGVEGIVMEKPLVYLNFHDIPETIPYVSLEAAIKATNIQELEFALDHLDDQETKTKLEHGRSRFIASYLHYLDGKSSERIVEIINSLI